MSGVRIRTARLAGNLYVLQGAGGNITASVGADGVLLVDDEFAPLAESLNRHSARHGRSGAERARDLLSRNEAV